MIEQGLAQLVQGNAAVAAIATAGGGYLAALPKGQALPSWTYQWIWNQPELTLNSVVGLVLGRLQIDCYGASAASVIVLSEVIHLALHGFRGTLDDVDQTYVDSAFRIDLHDPEFDEASRTWRRVMEFRVNYTNPF